MFDSDTLQIPIPFLGEAYSTAQIRRAFRSGPKAARTLNQLWYSRGHRRQYNESGIDIPAADWDTLIILDACRYDLFEARSTLPGELSAVRSRGSCTPEFLGANFGERDFFDTVYVTANPQFHYNRDSIDARFHDVINVWRDDGWDDEYGTVLPETTTEYALDVAEQYPNKRLIVHFMQPHYPFIADTDFDKGHLTAYGDDRRAHFWERIYNNDDQISPKAIRQAYARNFDVALPHVETLLTEQRGRTVVTADHGNMVGERAFPVPIREWGHPPGIYTEKLVKVPWLVHENGSRKNVQADVPVHDSTTIADDIVGERLRNLGYTE